MIAYNDKHRKVKMCKLGKHDKQNYMNQIQLDP